MLSINEVLTTNEAKENFMGGIVNLAKADGAIDDSEKQFFLNAAVSLGWEEKIDELNESLNSVENVIDIEFNSRKESLFFFKEALQLVYLDDKYDEEEKKVINEIRKQLDIEKEVVDEIENWVLEGMEWVKKGEKLIEME